MAAGPPAAAAVGAASASATAGNQVAASTDTYGNRWRLSADLRGVEVSPSRDPPLTSIPPEQRAWRAVATPAVSSQFVGVVPDEAGFIWLASETELWALSPRAAGSGPVEAGVGHSGQPTPNAVDPEWRPCPGAETLLAPLLPLRGLERSCVDAPAVVLVGGVLNQELTVHADGVPTLAAPVGQPSAGLWEPVGRVPCGNHDLFAAELDGDLWLSGGLTLAGFPAHNHCFDELWRLRLSNTPEWEVVTVMPSPRNYNGLVAFHQELWLVGGVANEEQPQSARGWRDSAITTPLKSVLVYNPRADHWRDGPSLQHSSPRPYPGGPIVVVAGGRIWAFATGWTGEPGASDETVESIGANESEWLQEAPLPASTTSGLWCSGGAGCVIGDRHVFICAEAGFLTLDTHTGAYDSALPAHPSAGGGELTPNGPLSATVCAHKGEVWVLGGAGIKAPDR